MRAAAILFFFIIAALAYLSVHRALGLQRQHRQDYLRAYTLYLGFWNALVLLSVMQHILAGAFLPARSMVPLFVAANPLFQLVVATSLYFYSSFMSQLAGHALPKLYKVVYAIAWGCGALLLAVLGAQSSGTISSYPVILSIVQYLLRTGTVLGWGLYLLLNLKKMDDPMHRRFLRDFVVILLAGYALFDLSLKMHPWSWSDYLIASLQIGFNFPPLFYLGNFLQKRSLTRPFDDSRPDVVSVLAPLGVSQREAEIVDHIVRGFSNKEIADRLCISVETVKKHSYNVYRKLGVQNRVQLSYFIQNRPQDENGRKR